MFVALSYVGKLPSYVVDCIHQVRIYFDEDIYLITDDLDSKYLKQLEKYDVIVENYKSVESQEFNNVVKEVYHKFYICKGLEGREELFIRSFERFFLLQNLMKLRNLTDCLFIELDNLIYDDPRKWLPEFSKHDICYMSNNNTTCSSGIMYVNNQNSLPGFLKYIVQYLRNTDENKVFISEMSALYNYYLLNSDDTHVHIIPTFWEDTTVKSMTYKSFAKYEDTIFDAQCVGIYLLGMDPYHNGGELKLGIVRKEWYFLDFSKYKFEWKTDEQRRKKPYVFNGKKWILINNLHVHSKLLQNGLSIPI